MKRVCVITDNTFLFKEMCNIIKEPIYSKFKFDFFYSDINNDFKKKYEFMDDFLPISLKKCDETFFQNYCLFLSLHCKQIFPQVLTDNYRCINIHPGYNPYNRGWFPQVFSILNKQDAGVTIHEIDRELDHGPIIFQEKIEIKNSDTSYDVYVKIQELEIKLLKEHLIELLENKYVAEEMKEEGNINLKKDFDDLCKIELDQVTTYKEVIDKLRALTFNGYKNAYFIDELGKKVYISISLEEKEV